MSLEVSQGCGDGGRRQQLWVGLDWGILEVCSNLCDSVVQFRAKSWMGWGWIGDIEGLLQPSPFCGCLAVLGRVCRSISPARSALLSPVFEPPAITARSRVVADGGQTSFAPLCLLSFKLPPRRTHCKGWSSICPRRSSGSPLTHPPPPRWPSSSAPLRVTWAMRRAGS